MSINIANLKYRDDKPLFHSYLIDNSNWFKNITILDGYKGKATISDFAITDALLSDASCTQTDKDVSIEAKNVDLKEYNFSIPIKKCELKKTWLSSFYRQNKDSEEVFLDGIADTVASQMQSEVKNKAIKSILAEAKSDTNVDKITVPDITTAVEAVNALKAFLDGFSEEFMNLSSIDEDSGYTHSVYVSPHVRHLAMSQLNLFGKKTLVLSGFEIKADSSLSGKEMYCTSERNILVVFDDSNDVNIMKVVDKEELNKFFIVGGVSFAGSYVDSKRIVISN